MLQGGVDPPPTASGYTAVSPGPILKGNVQGALSGSGARHRPFISGV